MMSNIVDVSLDEFIVENYFDYGNYINFNRVIPGVDGLKPVHRRILLAMHGIAVGKLTGTVNAIGASQVLHPFGDQSVSGVISDFARLEVIESQGDFGAKLVESIPAAAPRYTKVGLSKEQDEYYFRLLDYCSKHDGEEIVEPEHLLTPIPHALIYGGFNWGLGIISRTPGFTYQSLLAAYEEDNPDLLVPSFGYKMDKKDSELDELWNTGKGRLTLSYKVERLSSDEILIIGSGELFSPNLRPFNELIDSGQIKIENDSDTKVILRITRIPRARLVDMDEVFEIAKRVGMSRKHYDIKLVYQGKIMTISIKDWLTITMKLYKDAFNKYKSDVLLSLDKDAKVYSTLPEIAKMLINNDPDESILKALSIEQDVLDAAKRKSLGTLRRSEFTSELERIENKRKSVESEDIDATIKGYSI